MIKIEKRNYDKIYNLYLKGKDHSFFPLIAAVLLDEQDGVVYADDNKNFLQVYVEHAFGFSQIFGESVNNFELKLKDYMLISKCFKPNKIRLYTPSLPEFLKLPKYEENISYRQRLTLSSENLSFGIEMSDELMNNIGIFEVDDNNISLIDCKFTGIVERFWRNKSDFLQKSNAIIVYYKGEPASICYSAATANHCVEIDVLTLPNYRTLGLAKLSVKAFINRCFSLSLQPLWDCFTNNAASMNLCKSIGFIMQQKPYPFFTINKY